MMVLVSADDLALVVQLACLTESRDNDEQEALVKLAQQTAAAGGPDIVASVICTWDPVE